MFHILRLLPQVAGSHLLQLCYKEAWIYIQAIPNSNTLPFQVGHVVSGPAEFYSGRNCDVKNDVIHEAYDVIYE